MFWLSATLLTTAPCDWQPPSLLHPAVPLLQVTVKTLSLVLSLPAHYCQFTQTLNIDSSFLVSGDFLLSSPDTQVLV